MSSPIYKVSDGSVITFGTRGPLRYATITKPNGEVIKGREWLSSAIDYPGIAEEILLANNIIDYNAGGAPLPYTIEGSQDQPTSDPKITNYVYEISRITMEEITDQTALNTANVNNEVASQNNKVLESTLETQLPPDVKFINFVNSQKSTAQKLLIPVVIGLITPFAPQLIPLIVSNLGISGDSTVDSIQSAAGDKKAAAQGALASAEGSVTEGAAKEAASDPATQKAAALFVLGQIPKEQLIAMINCPTAAKIKSIIIKRNQLVKQINGIYKSITTLSSILALTFLLNQALGVAIFVVLNLPFPVPINVIFKMADIRNFINANTGKVSGIIIAIASFGVFLGIVLKFLNMLDIILQYCSEDKNMDLEQINNEINALANPTVVATQSEDNTYKGFTLGVKIDETNESKYIKRYAVAQNKQGVDVLKTESSFASDPSVLVSQLKFIIDTNPNITAE